METNSKHLQRIIWVGYAGLLSLFLLIYFLSGFLPVEQASLGKLLQDVSLNLAIALTISFGSYALLRPILENRDRKTLEDFQNAALELLTLEKGVREAGVVRIYDSLNDEILQKRLSEAKERVCFLSIWLDSPEKRLGKYLPELAKRGVSLKILQANPEADVCRVRADSQKALFPEASSYEPAFVTNLINQNIAYFSKLQSEVKENVEVRLFDVLPPFSLILIDDSAFLGLYGYGEKASSAPRIEFRLNAEGTEYSFFRDFIIYQFETIWDKAAPIS